LETLIHVLAAAFYLLGAVYYAMQIYRLTQRSKDRDRE
jgi:hypothetical protein